MPSEGGEYLGNLVDQLSGSTVTGPGIEVTTKPRREIRFEEIDGYELESPKHACSSVLWGNCRQNCQLFCGSYPLRVVISNDLESREVL